MSILAEMSALLQKGKSKKVKELVQQAMDEGIDAQVILEEGLLSGMNAVGEAFQNNEIFVPEVLVAARAMSAGTELLKPLLQAGDSKVSGKVCIGSIKGDLHDIGKNLVRMLMEGKGLKLSTWAMMFLSKSISKPLSMKTAISSVCPHC
jgi:methanogenic corrinoid protein MtbC1